MGKRKRRSIDPTNPQATKKHRSNGSGSSFVDDEAAVSTGVVSAATCPIAPGTTANGSPPPSPGSAGPVSNAQTPMAARSSAMVHQTPSTTSSMSKRTNRQAAVSGTKRKTTPLVDMTEVDCQVVAAALSKKQNSVRLPSGSRLQQLLDRFELDGIAPFRLKLKTFYDLYYIPLGENADQMLEKAIDSFFKNNRNIHHSPQSKDVTKIKNHLKNELNWFVADSEQRIFKILLSYRPTSESNADCHIARLTTAMTSFAETSKQQYANTQQQFKTIAETFQQNFAKSQQQLAQVSQDCNAKIREVSQDCNAKIREVNQDYNAKILGVQDEVKAVVGLVGTLGKELQKHEKKLCHLESESRNHAKAIFDHSGQLADLKIMQETQRREHQRLVAVVEAFQSASSGTEEAASIGTLSQAETDFVAALESQGENQLSKEEIKFCKRFIRSYVSGNYVNDHLRGLVSIESTENEVAKFLKLVPCFLTEPYTKTVYRGADHDDKFFEKIKLLLAEPKKHGPVYYQDYGFLSTSATEFSKQKLMQFSQSKNTHFIIESLTGRHIAKYSQQKEEDEVLFLPCTRFEITKYEVVRDKHVIHMRELPK